MGRCGGSTDVFSECTRIEKNFSDIYCCSGTENKIIGAEVEAPDLLFVANGTCREFTFPLVNDEDSPMLKSALNSTTMSPWVRIAFQEYCEDFTRSPEGTSKTIITTGNVSISGGGKLETCNATIQEFQYGWGLINNGNRCRVTILDEKGGSFETWAKRITSNTEGASKPVIGSYKMKVQFGWYITGGSPDDQCGQGTASGQNSSFNICSPTIWFMPDNITANWQNGKFIYTLEGTDITYKSQDQHMAKVNGQDGSSDDPFAEGMYFTEAVALLGAQSMPPFRVRFLALAADGTITSMVFLGRPGQSQDDVCSGPFDVWKPYERTPLAIIQSWIQTYGVLAVDQTGNIQTKDRAVGIFMNYDSTQDLGDKLNSVTKFPIDACEALAQNVNVDCVDDLPDVGTLILWTGSALPQCQGNIPDFQFNKRMKAVYVVNGGNCINGASEILTEDGWQRINNVVKNKYNGKIACLGHGNEFTWSKINNWYKNKINERKLIKVHLHNSSQRKGSISGAIFTEDHPILTDSGYVEVKYLNIVGHKINSGTYQPSKELHQATLGMILGDGYIRRKSYSFYCAHSEKQRAYIAHKAAILGLEVVNKPTKKYPTCKITSKSSPYWRSLRKLFYPDGVKVITKSILKDFSIISLAYLFMDDGYLKLNKKLAEIATCGFTSEEVDLLIDKIHELGIKCYKRKVGKYSRIYFSVEQTKILSEKIAPYVIESMNYKILEKHRFVDKIKLNTKQEIFYDTFDLIRCDKLEKTTELVYCIDVETHHNFITHSGVVHNCSPVISFNPVTKWHFITGLKAGGASVPVSGTQVKQAFGTDATGCAVAGGRGATIQAVTNMGQLGKQTNPVVQTQKAVQLFVMANMIVGGIQAELKVQGDPSNWLCSPLAGTGKCVGIIFINPFFLQEDTAGECPQFMQTTSGLCNNYLTNKGWFLDGVDHQIKDSSFVTTLKLRCPLPGVELKFNSGGGATSAGAYAGGPKASYGGTQANPSQYPDGSKAVEAIPKPTGVGCAVCWIGGGSGCDSGTICDSSSGPTCDDGSFCDGTISGEC